MKFSERFFKFPIRVYDSISIKRVIKEELREELTEENLGVDISDGKEPKVKVPDWVEGWANIPFWALSGMYYHDSFSLGREPEEVAENGFDMTSVYHKDFGDFDCTWKTDKFEKRLNDFAERYETYYKDKIAEATKGGTQVIN